MSALSRTPDGDTAALLADRSTDDDGLVHVMPLDDDNIALCGADRTGRPFAPEGTPTTCPVCAALDEMFPVDE